MKLLLLVASLLLGTTACSVSSSHGALSPDRERAELAHHAAAPDSAASPQ